MKSILINSLLAISLLLSCSPKAHPTKTSISKTKVKEEKISEILTHKQLTHSCNCEITGIESMFEPLFSSVNGADFYSESSIYDSENNELIFIHERTIYKDRNRYSHVSRGENSEEISYYKITFLSSKKSFEVERYNAFEVIKLLDDNGVFINNGLNNTAIEKLILKYGENSISSLTTNNNIKVIIR